MKCHHTFLVTVLVLERKFYIGGYCTQITGICAKFELCSEKLHLIIEFRSVLQLDTPG